MRYVPPPLIALPLATIVLALTAGLWAGASVQPRTAEAAPTGLNVGLDMKTSQFGPDPGTYGSTLPPFESCVDVSTSVNNGQFYIDLFVLNITQVVSFSSHLNYDTGKLQILESDVFKFLGTSASVYNTSSNITPVFTGITVSPPDGDGSYYVAAFNQGGYTSGSGVLTRIKAQALIPPSGGRDVSFQISNSPTAPLIFTDNALGHPGDTNGDHTYDGAYINRVGTIAVDRPDNDGDGFSSTCDNCPSAFNADQTNTDVTVSPPGDSLGDACDPDDDNDGVADGPDNCDLVPNPGQQDVNGNGTGDACEDSDGDGILDGLDNCPSNANANQANNDGDSQGDACDPDDDNDGVPDTTDNCDFVPNPGQQDVNSNGIGDACEDSDGDGILDGLDNCPLAANPTQGDSDGDGAGDACDNCYLPNPGQGDWNNDGIGDACQNYDGDYFTFNDAEEVFVGTIPGTKCPATTTADDEAIDAWPPDFNDSKQVNLGDVLRFIPVFGADGPQTPTSTYKKRYDLNTDNKIALADVLMFIPVFNVSC